MSANPVTDPEAWDTIAFGGVYMPGLAKVEKPKRIHKWDEKKSKGSKGNKITYQGFDNAEFDVTLRFADRFDTGQSAADQIDEWNAKAPALEPNPDPTKTKALDVIHPALEPLNIHAIVMSEIGGVEHVGGGMFEVHLKCKEFTNPKPAGGSPSGSSSSGGFSTGHEATAGGKPPPNAQDAQDAEIARLAAEAKKP